MSNPVVYTDDPDAHWTFTVHAEDGTSDVDWPSPKVAVDGSGYTIDAEWVTDPSPDRKIKVPLADLDAGFYNLFLQVPGDNDIQLDDAGVHVIDRTA